MLDFTPSFIDTGMVSEYKSGWNPLVHKLNVSPADAVRASLRDLGYAEDGVSSSHGALVHDLSNRFTLAMVCIMPTSAQATDAKQTWGVK